MYWAIENYTAYYDSTIIMVTKYRGAADNACKLIDMDLRTRGADDEAVRVIPFTKEQVEEWLTKS